MIVVVTTDEGKTVWKSGELVRRGDVEGLCCGQDNLAAVVDELQCAFCFASRLLAGFDDSYGVLDACCAPAEIEDDVPIGQCGGQGVVPVASYRSLQHAV